MQMKQLSRSKLRNIMGGTAIAGCKADCPGSNPDSVACFGTYCVATDGVGCKSSSDNKSCPPPRSGND
jgi:hypothetical protein